MQGQGWLVTAYRRMSRLVVEALASSQSSPLQAEQNVKHKNIIQLLEIKYWK